MDSLVQRRRLRPRTCGSNLAAFPCSWIFTTRTAVGPVSTASLEEAPKEEAPRIPGNSAMCRRLTRGRLTRGRLTRGRLTRGRLTRGRLTRGYWLVELAENEIVMLHHVFSLPAPPSYSAGTSTPSILCDPEDRYFTSGDNIYHLVAVVSHLGVDNAGGHFVTFRKCPPTGATEIHGSR